MNTNMYAESFHRVLKIIYLNHKQLHNKVKGNILSECVTSTKGTNKLSPSFHSAKIIKESENS